MLFIFDGGSKTYYAVDAIGLEKEYRTCEADSFLDFLRKWDEELS